MTAVKTKWNAEDYADNSSVQELWANELIGKLDLQGNEQLLDIGCGDGKITHSMAGKIVNGKVVGIDRSEDMIELAVKKFNLPNLSFFTMDATAMSLKERFDVAFSNAALHWVKDQKAVLAQLKKHLTQSAKILFQMGGHGNAEDIFKVIEQIIASENWLNYYKNFVFPYRFCTINDYARWLPACGYKASRIELIPKDMVHETVEDLKGWLRTTWFPYTDPLPDNKKEEFLDLVVERYTDVVPVDSEGRTHVKMVRLEVEAISG